MRTAALEDVYLPSDIFCFGQLTSVATLHMLSKPKDEFDVSLSQIGTLNPFEKVGTGKI